MDGTSLVSATIAVATGVVTALAAVLVVRLSTGWRFRVLKHRAWHWLVRRR